MINPQPEEMSRGTLTLACEPTEIHLNHNQDVNAGVLFSLAEMAGMGVVVTSLDADANDSYVVIKRCEIDFIAPAKGRVRATAHLSEAQLERIESARVNRTGIEEAVSVEILNSHDRVVSKCEMTAVIRPKKGPSTERDSAV